ncbi:MAG: metalloregulator ArsR/SmtB family transcription factor [Nitrospirota bacterium]|nr:metalloregulator ArsR/SmtB family transcription factor [Nitrospirota bacterium]
MDVFVAIAEPNRRRLLDLLAERDRTAGELAAALPSLTQPGVSRHLKVLREVGLVRSTVKAQTRIYSLQPERLFELERWISRYRQYWGQHLDSFEEHLRNGTARQNQESEMSGNSHE